MVEIAQTENRIIITRDTHIMERKKIANGLVKALLLKSDDVCEQTQIMLDVLNLKSTMYPFSLCLECNHKLVSLSRDKVRERVPAYVWQTQKEYVECPECLRVYWKGTHWTAMTHDLKQKNIIEA
jgi:uncharacterized protein